MLNDEELLRYSRQILLKQIDVAGQLRLKKSKVLIVGLGGLGSPVALYLAAAGVGELYLADFDHLDLSNLQRQIVHDSAAVGRLKVQSAQARLQALNPHIAVHALSAKLDSDNLPALLQSVDLVVDCTDNFTIRAQLNAACFANNTVLVSGAAIRGEGQISVYDPSNAASPCYHCVFGDGEEEGLTCSEAGVLGPLVGLIGSLQALEAMKILAGFGETLVGRLLLVDAFNSRFRELKIRRDPQCSVCGVRHA
ncbi:MAG: molybdopterin-synthase adenylyltransferase MoeB [Pseudomonas sp.]|jgi:adenylyltransferase/sulfurtransferase|nr:molybdopterin-synthase adenylyltransferase MoeB [Pseudomonas sp.]MDD2222749.1 molybdopterin-synthase adenylyltransferase MoeB [Pseudomonas sp.]MDY0415429.1 molybdopterin-synthase adenylyltransferase MoeB [Pseudomonas sp.]NLO53289.1 molybdopterin-synthase adenylyltransferase MoeB [Gammaproteobacteria bacterium]